MTASGRVPAAGGYRGALVLAALRCTLLAMGLSLAVAYGVASVIYATTPAKGRDELSDHGGSLILFGFWMLVATVVAMSAFSAVRVARRHRARMGVSRDLALVTAVPMLLQAGLSVPAYAKGIYGSSVLVAGVGIAVLGLAIAIVATRSTATAPLVVMCGVGAAPWGGPSGPAESTMDGPTRKSVV